MTRDPFWSDFKVDMTKRLQALLKREIEAIPLNPKFKPNNGATVIRREVE